MLNKMGNCGQWWVVGREIPIPRTPATIETSIAVVAYRCEICPDTLLVLTAAPTVGQRASE